MRKEYKSLAESLVYETLLHRAEEPYDLTQPDSLTREGRLGKYVCRGPLFNLHYAAQRIDDDVLVLFQQLADELKLVDQFESMRRGAIMNRIDGFASENRQVLHTACRDIFSDSPAEPLATGLAKHELDQLKSFLDGVSAGRITNEAGLPFTCIVHIGIGGSDLGPRAVYEALAAYTIADRQVHFLSNVDPDDAAVVLQKVTLERALVVVVSKSGTTQETLTNEKLIVRALKERGLNPKAHCIAVTGQGSPMDCEEKYLRTFHLFDFVGGRFSTTSMVGAVVLSFLLGSEAFEQFLAGAWKMDLHATNPVVRENVPLLLALLGVWNRNFLHYPTVAVLPYSQALHRFPAHLQQCDMESNGKSLMRDGRAVLSETGPLLWGEPGTNGQHAFYQLLHQGTGIVPVEFIGFLQPQYTGDEQEVNSSQNMLLANLYAQIVAMAVGQKNTNPNQFFPGNRPSSLLVTQKLNPETMGALLALYEAKIVFQGFIWNINSFDQEGVQLGKVLAKRFLRAIASAENADQSLEKQFVNQVQSLE
ncbi:MAG: glucose-6-phosphate isomerase [Deltaproteobacteria bacterium]|nr:MAG: glucose-6-phosphate isomerase [Deltaproteobacteria bacterium]